MEFLYFQGVVHIDQFKFKMLVFESEGHTMYGDTSGESYTIMQTKLVLSGAICELKIPEEYSYDATTVKITGVHSASESGQEKEINVKFEKSAGNLATEKQWLYLIFLLNITLRMKWVKLRWKLVIFSFFKSGCKDAF